MFSVGIGRLVKEEVIMTGLRSRPGSLGIAVCSSLMLALVAGISLSELRADITPLSGAEAQRVLGGQSSCSYGYYVLEVPSTGCDSSKGCTNRQNAVYTGSGSTYVTIRQQYCYNFNSQQCGTVQSALAKCTND